MSGMSDDLFNVFDDSTGASQQTKVKSNKRKAHPGTSPSPTPASASSAAASSSSSQPQQEESKENASSETSSKKLKKTDGSAVAAPIAASAAVATSSSSASSSSAMQVDEHALNDDDSSFYSYTPQHVSVKTKTEREDTRSCLSEVCYPPNWDLNQEMKLYTPTKPAKEYPFVLDPFQRHAIDCLERNQSVLVSAHTSAGKTVVAEYAIAMALRDGQRVIYTSPIKALSNQKYRELQEEFNDVGLMTGDVTINPSASCLVMTTEILRNMLYRGSEVMREAAFVIFDEVHYMRNKERGVVWEETIIMLPDKVRYVFLSATIPNGTEFALWIAKLHKQPCNVVYTDYRPTPLQHYLFPAGGEGLYLVVDEKGTFREENFQKALAVLKADPNLPGAATAAGAGADEKTDGGGGKGSKKKKGQSKPTAQSDIYKIVKMIMERHLEPVIIFSFSKRECESHALTLSKLDFSNEDEKKLIDQIFANAMEALSDDDRHLPQVENILPLLRRGIGIHHGGLLPILKEVIEILFQEGLVKALFSTETFAMGINAPCKCALFTSVKKWDGDQFRVVSGGEYIQMSGRAGRRGIDDRGIVILMMDEQLEPNQAKEMMKGQSDSLDSSFHLGYNMLLNLLRVEDQNPVKMMARSFLQFQNTRKAPAIQEKLEEMEKKREEIHVKDTKLVSEYYHLLEQQKQLQEKMTQTMIQPNIILPFLQPGRVLHIRSERAGQRAWGWGVLVSFQKKTLAKDIKGQFGGKQGEVIYVLDVLLHCAPGSGAVSTQKQKGKAAPKLAQNIKPAFLPSESLSQQGSEFLIVPVLLTLVDQIGQMKCNLAPFDLKTAKGRDTLGMGLYAEVQKYTAGANTKPEETKEKDSKKDKKKNKEKEKEKPAPAAASSSPSTPAAASTTPASLPVLDPITNMNISDPAFLQTHTKYQQVRERLSTHKYATASDSQEQLDLYAQRLAYDREILTLRSQLRDATQDVTMSTQLRHMQVVLRRLEHTTSSNVIDLKGRVACEISTCDELLGTELMFLGVFNELQPEQIVALCSCLVFGEKADDEPVRLKEELAAPLRILQEAARRIASVMNDAQIIVDVEEYVARFQPHLMEVVYAWCKGSKFSEVCKLTEVFEGTIIRCLRRLEELLRQFATAAKSVGNDLLDQKFTAGIAMLKRDIVFAASLYL